MKKYHIILILTILNLSLVIAQNSAKENIEELTKREYDSLGTLFWKLQSSDSIIKAKKYAQAFLLKAKKENKIEGIADAYFMLAYATRIKEESVLYADSVIALTKNEINYRQPVAAHLLKANQYGTEGSYDEAFEELDKANFYANSTGNINQVNEIKYLIARLKANIGDYQSSLNLLKEVQLYYEQTNNIRGYILSLWSYGQNLNFLKKADSALAIVNKAISYSLKTQDSMIYDRLLLSTAISNYEKKNFKSSLDSISKLRAISEKKGIKNIESDILMHLYLGKIYLKEQKDEYALYNLKKVDSISLNKQYVYPLIRENYELLINYYRERKDVDNQLLYINKLLAIDSVLDQHYTSLTGSINNKYTTPNLLLEQKRIISTLEENNSKKAIALSVLMCFLIVLGVLLYLDNKKKHVYKKRIEALGIKRKVAAQDIKDETAKRILDDLYKIEETQKFLDEDFNLGTLAKQLGTNTSYLSKIINDHKQKTFKQYLIELRINVLLENLDENSIMRKYSIEALAASIGYKNASSFTRIFKNYLGESPSSFLNKKYPERKQ